MYEEVDSVLLDSHIISNISIVVIVIFNRTFNNNMYDDFKIQYDGLM